MTWQPAGRRGSASLLTFLRNEEWRHIALTSRIRADDDAFPFGRLGDGRIWRRGSSGASDGALFISRFGVVLPAYDPAGQSSADRDFLRRLLVSRRDRLFSVIGMADRVLDVESRLGETPPDTQSYRMLTGEHSASSAGTTLPEVNLEEAGPEHLDLLWPLEKAYQEEEVLRKGSRLNERAGRRHFLETLRRQMVFYAMIDGQPVAKAGTNARGWQWDQIGGVYVVPELRSRGIARTVMDRLLKEIREAGRKPCLFVKTGNAAALALYGSMGFDDRGAFRISYWD